MKTTGNEIREDERQKINPRNIFSEGLAVPKAGAGGGSPCLLVRQLINVMVMDILTDSDDFNVIMQCSLIMEKGK